MSFNKSTFETTYKDDFDSSDNFHRILFNSGRALQRENLRKCKLSFKRRLQGLVGIYLKKVP